MAAGLSEAVNESSERQETMKEDPDLSVYYEAREMWILDQQFGRLKREKKDILRGLLRGISRDTLLDV